MSLFPLLLVLVTVLGFVLEGDPDLQHEILNGTLGQFPILRDQLKLHSLSGSGLALCIGLVVSVLAGLGIMNASQNAFNRIWGVPFKDRPDFLFIRLRGLLMLAILGAMAIISTVAAGFVGSATHGAAAVVAGVIVAFAFNLALFMLAFKLLVAIELSWRELLPGVIVAAVCWQLLQHLGGLLHRPHAQTHGAAVRRLRSGAGTARVAVYRRTAHDLRGREQRRQSTPAVAA